ncbi:fatty acid desaturase family protein [Yoonia sp. 208BN28-4]|uniref:fatty acid desaturase family protein n=1 Tax=Yoonia sp. 208BN28-4 TaxID=3126505 RepID=UPI0030AD387B
MSIRRLAKPYAAPIDSLAWFHVANTAALYAGAIVLGTMFWGNFLVMAVAVLMFFAGTTRFFGIQHDCGHLSYFKSRRTNEVVGVLTGAFTGNAYYAMRYNHNRHHAYIGNLDERDAHEVLTWTVAEYQAASPGMKLFYRIYRSAFVLYFIGPIFVIFIRYRYPKNAAKTGMRDILMQNTLMFGFWASLWILFGWQAFAFTIIAGMISACMGVFMVYVGHNYEDAYWEHAESCNFEDASLKGSSVLDWGPLFHFATFNFAFHDLHHLHAKIPCYRLQACHRALENELEPTRLGVFEAIACVQWKLWDEASGKMIRFRDLPQSAPATVPAE